MANLLEKSIAAKAQAPAEPAEIAQWRAFAQHCQRLVGALKSKMTNEQVLEFLGEEMDEQINRLSSSDTSDIDPDLLKYAEDLFGEAAAPKAPAENTSATEGVRDDAAVLLGKEIEELIATEFGITGGTIHSKVNKLVVLAAGKAPVEYPPV